MAIAANRPPRTVFPIHRIHEARDNWRKVRRGLEELESCLEQRIPVPPEHCFGGMMGYEWEPRLAELSARLSLNLTSRVIPAIEACCRHPDVTTTMRELAQSAVAQLRDAVQRCQKVRSTLAKASKQRASRAGKLAALTAAQSLIVGVLISLDDLLHVAELN
jgi:hypothetical protein